MPRQCNGCYKLGHMKWECTQEKLNWRGYVLEMKETGKFEKSLFGSWLDEKPMEEGKDREKEKAKEKEPEKPREREKDGDRDREKPTTSSGDLRDILDLKSPGALKKALADYLIRHPPKGSRERRRSQSPPRHGNWKQDRRRSPERRRSPDRRQSPQRHQSNNRDQRGRSPHKGYNKYKWVNKNGWQNRKRHYGKDRSPDEKRGKK